MALLAEFGGSDAIQADARFGRFERQLPVQLRWNADHELAAETPEGDRFRHGLLVRLQVSDCLGHNLPDAAQCRFWFGRQPTQAGKLGTQADIFRVLLRPGDTVGIAVIIEGHFLPPKLLHYDSIIIDTAAKRENAQHQNGRRESHRIWLEAALNTGLPLESFLLVEWTLVQ
jgi:hypothetical protein